MIYRKSFQTLWHLGSAYTSLPWLIQNSSCSNNPLISKHLCSSFTIFCWHANEQPQVGLFNFFCSPFFQILIGLERCNILWAFFSPLNVFFMLLIIHILEKGGKKTKLRTALLDKKKWQCLLKKRLQVKFRLGRSCCNSIELLPDYS